MIQKIVLDFVCIPLHKGTKRPIILNWQHVKRTQCAYFEKNCNMGIQCGKNSNILVIDVDIKDDKKETAEKFIEKFELLKKCGYIVKTSSGGYHFYFKYDSDISSCHPKFDDIACIDVCSDYTQVVSPPSEIKGGGKYTVKKGNIYELNEIPELLKEFIMSWISKRKNKTKEIKEGLKIDYKKIEEIEDLNEENILILKKILNHSSLVKQNIKGEEWYLITRILKKYGLLDIWDEWSKLTTSKEKINPKYNKTNNMKIWENACVTDLNTDITYLQLIYNIHSSEHLEIIPQEKYKKITINVKNRIEINEQYLMKTPTKINKDIKKIIDNEKCVLIRAPMGSAKTTLVNNYMQNINEKFISIVSRISLADSQYKTFSKNSDKYTHYANIKSKNKDNLITTCDSLTHLDLSEFSNRIVYLDEISSILHYITTADHIKKQKEVFSSLINILKNAKKIIATDADLNDSVFFFFEMLDIKYTYIDNIYKKDVNTEHHCYFSESEFFEMYKNISKKEKTIFCADTKAKVDIAALILKELRISDDDIIIITSDKTPLDKEKKLIDTENWHNKYILYSPSIVYGVDFVPEKSMSIFVHVEGKTINPLQITQQIFRCRKQKNIYSHIKPIPRKTIFTNFNEVKEFYGSLAVDQLCANDIIGYNFFIDSEIEEMNAIFDNIYFYQKLQDNMTMANYYYYICEYLKQKGIKTYSHIKTNNDKIDVSAKIDGTQELKEEAEKIINQMINGGSYEISQNPIIKRIEMLKLMTKDKTQSIENIEKYKDIIYDDSKFKKHMRTCLYVDLMENPNEIKKMHYGKIKDNYIVKVNNSAVGIFESLRKLKYNDCHDKDIVLENIKKVTRLKTKIFDDKFFYKVLSHLGVEIEMIRETTGKKKRLYTISKDQLDFHKELKQIRQDISNELNKSNELNWSDIIDLV